MEWKVYAIFDSAANAFMPPMFVRSHGEFMRGFIDECNNPKSNLYRYPADYCAFELGTFNDLDGGFNLVVPPKSFGLAQEYKKYASSELRSEGAPIRGPVEVDGGAKTE